MQRTTVLNTTTRDKMVNALKRVVNQAVNKDGAADAYLCRLQLPKQFSNDIKESNDIYKKIQSDFCKNVMRSTGSTPRYVAVKTENSDNPEYAFCLFTKHDASLDKPEEYAEKGREIANGKVGQAGWGHGKLDVVEMIMDSPKFMIASNSVQITQDNKASVVEQLQRHLQGQSQSTQAHQRTLFVSKTRQ